MRVIRQVGTVLAYATPAFIVLFIVFWFLLGLLRGVETPLVSTLSSGMKPSVRQGDLVLLRRTSPGSIEIGDVVAFRRDGDVVFRRVVERDQRGSFFEYRVKGDNRPDVDEEPVTDDDILGELDTRLPLIGLGLIILESLAGRVLLAAVFLFCVAAILRLRWEKRHGSVEEPPVSAEPEALPYGGDDHSERPAPPAAPSIRETAMSITPAELRHVRFAQVRRGYDTEAVDRALESVADSIEELLHERHELVERVRQLEAEIERYREVESTLSQTLTLAERAAEELKAEAQAEADTLMVEARAQMAAAQQAQAAAQQAQAAAASAAAAQPATASTSALPDPAFIELLGETRAIRSLLQAMLTQAPPGGGSGAPFAPRPPA